MMLQCWTSVRYVSTPTVTCANASNHYLLFTQQLNAIWVILQSQPTKMSNIPLIFQGLLATWLWWWGR